MDAPQEIKSRLDIADMIGEYLQLKPAGSGSFKACCPFHQEKTPSFYVNRPRQSWHCFGCDQGGDLLSFIQKMEGLDFPETLALLAQRAGITLPNFNVEASSERKRLYEVNDLASRFFHAQLLSSPQAEAARAYAKRRGIDDLTGDVWRIGYAPNQWSDLTEALKGHGVTEAELVKVGLVQKRDSGGVYDRFRDRLMFSIFDVHGHIVGFTGRTLSPDTKEAKYVNTPETILYKKSGVLYGLDKARGEIRRQDLAVIVEGNMDVVSSHQYGITHVVASSGTALTSDQLLLLKRFTTNLAIAFDADAAGNAATLRGLDVARALDFSIRVISLPAEVKDPDELVRKDPTLWREAIQRALPIMDWLYGQAFTGVDSTTPEGKKNVARQILPEIKRISNAVERDAWLKRLANDLAISEEALKETMRGLKQPTGGNTIRSLSLPTPLPEPPAKKTRYVELEERLSALLILKPEWQDLAQSLMPSYTFPGSFTPQQRDYFAVFADREFPDQQSDVLQTELERTCAALQDLHRIEMRNQLEQRMRQAEREHDTAKIEALLIEFRDFI